MDNESRKRYLLRNTTIFTLGALATKLISFFLVPLYTNTLSTAEYGTVDLVTTLVTIISPFITLNVAEAVMRFCLDKDADIDGIINISIVTAAFSIVIAAPLIPAFAQFGETADYAVIIYLYTVVTGLGHLWLYVLRGKELLVRYSVGCIISSLATAILNIYFLVCLGLGIRGYFYANVFSATITAVYSFIAADVWSSIKQFRFDILLAKSMYRYSVVLIPNSFMWWIMNSSDRVMVTAALGVAANGIYAVSYKIPGIISSLAGIFIQAWNYSAIREQDSKDSDEYTGAVFNRVFELLVLAGTGILLVIKPFLRLYVNERYYAAWEYVPYLVVGVVFLTLASFLSSSYTVYKDSWGFLKSGTFGAVINILLNWLLIPMFGIAGAAFATCISYIVVFVYRVFDTRKYMKVRITRRSTLIGAGLLVVSAITEYIQAPHCYVFLALEFCIALFLYRKTILSLVKTVLCRRAL